MLQKAVLSRRLPEYLAKGRVSKQKEQNNQKLVHSEGF